MSDKTIVYDGVEIDKHKANQMLTKIIIREAKNIKTKQHNDAEMARSIKKMIEEEVQCYSNQ